MRVRVDGECVPDQVREVVYTTTVCHVTNGPTDGWESILSMQCELAAKEI